MNRNGWKLAHRVTEFPQWYEDQGYLMVARPSGYLSTPWEFLTARYNAEKRRWDDPSGTAVLDSGADVIWYRELPPTPPERITQPDPKVCEMCGGKQTIEVYGGLAQPNRVVACPMCTLWL